MTLPGRFEDFDYDNFDFDQATQEELDIVLRRLEEDERPEDDDVKEDAVSA